MSLDINRYTLKCWIKFAYGLKPNVDFVVSYIWGEHCIDDLPQSPIEKDMVDSVDQLRDRFGTESTIHYNSESDSLTLKLKHSSWSVLNMTDQYWITFDNTSFKYVHKYIWTGPIEILVESLIEFDKLVPFIIEQCEEIETKKRKKQILTDMAVATARGMIEDMVSQGQIDIPKDYVIRGTDIGRVVLYFHSPKCTINTPLDYLRARLIRRFPNKSTRIR